MGSAPMPPGAGAEHTMFQLLRRLFYVLHRGRLEADFAEEIEFHRAMSQRDAEAAGHDAREAALTARRVFGSGALAQNRSRDVWIPPSLQDLASDVRFAFRLFAKEPRVTVAAVTALALGIGATNTVF